MTEKVIIIGGVAGGATAAARLRRISEDVEIILVGTWRTYFVCQLWITILHW